MRAVSLFIAACLLSGAGAAFGADDKSDAVKYGALVPIQVTRTALVESKNSMVTRIAIDPETRTAYLMSIFANGTVRTMRVSRVGAVRQGVEYKGWPYIVNKRGQLLAFDLSMKTKLMTKIPVFVGRLKKTFPKASAIAVSLWGLVWLYNWHYADETFGPGMYPETAAGAGFLTYLITDAVRTFLFRSNFTHQRGGNFFTRQLAKGVDSLHRVPGSEDYEIAFRKGQSGTKSYLSGLVPDYSKDTSCIYELTKLVNE